MAFRILIVDDSPVMRNFIRRAVTMAGLEMSVCLEASNGHEALALLREHQLDLMLTDVNMPGMNGAELLSQMNREGLLAQAPVLVVSTDATRRGIQKMLELGAYGYMTKPFSPEQLSERIDKVLEACGHAR